MDVNLAERPTLLHLSFCSVSSQEAQVTMECAISPRSSTGGHGPQRLQDPADHPTITSKSNSQTERRTQVGPGWGRWGLSAVQGLPETRGRSGLLE